MMPSTDVLSLAKCLRSIFNIIHEMLQVLFYEKIGKIKIIKKFFKLMFKS